MNTLLAPQRPSGIPDTQRLTSRPPHVSLADRVALHIGLRLVLWSTRTPRLALDREAALAVVPHTGRPHRAGAPLRTRGPPRSSAVTAIQGSVARSPGRRTPTPQIDILCRRTHHDRHTHPASSSARSSSPSPSTPTTPPISARWCGSATSSTARSRVTTTDPCAADELLPHLKPDEYRLLVDVGRRRRRSLRRPGHASSSRSGGRIEGRVLAHRDCSASLGPRHRLGGVRARRADRTRARPDGPAVVGGASRPLPARGSRRRPASARFPRITRRGSSCGTATRSSRSSATASSTSPGRSSSVERLLAEARSRLDRLPGGAVVRRPLLPSSPRATPG